MKLTRYFQSCLLIEDGDARVLIDPSGHETDRADEFGALDAVIYTHEHGDHFDAELADKFAQSGAAMYANASTAKQMKTKPNVVTDGDEFEVKGLSLKAVELPHCLMVDGSSSVQNTGYLIGGRLFHPGDGKELADISAEVLAVPLNGPDISMHDAYAFTIQVGAKAVVPIHYDYLGGNPDFLGNYLAKQNVKVHKLDVGQSTEI